MSGAARRYTPAEDEIIKACDHPRDLKPLLSIWPDRTLEGLTSRRRVLLELDRGNKSGMVVHKNMKRTRAAPRQQTLDSLRQVFARPDFFDEDLEKMALAGTRRKPMRISTQRAPPRSDTK